MVEEIALAINSPKAYTSKILQELSKQKIINSLKGPTGGFYLTPSQLNNNLIKVIYTFEGEHFFEKCILGLSECSSMEPCPMHSQFESMRLQLETLFSSTTVQDLTNDLLNHKILLKR
jgi:Rrf2 family iron-sulfur cluster assembly transcriptional regulator